MRATPTPNTPWRTERAKPTGPLPLQRGADGELIVIAATPAVGGLARIAHLHGRRALQPAPTASQRAHSISESHSAAGLQQPSPLTGVYDRLSRQSANACSLAIRPTEKERFPFFLVRWITGGGSVNNSRISVRSGAGNNGDRRCPRANCVFPNPTVRFDLDRRVVAVWSWFGVGVAGDANRVKINIVPTMLLVPVSYN